MGDEAQAQQPAPKPVFTGITGNFNTLEELSTYTKSLEKKMFEANLQNEAKPTYQQIDANPIAPTAKQPLGTKLSELVFQDPERAFALHEEQVLEKVRAVTQQEKNKEIFWKGFYDEHPDLKDVDDIVKSTVAYKKAEFGPLPVPIFKEKVAQEVRRMLNKVKDQYQSSTQEVKSKAANFLGTSGGPGVQAPEPVVQAPKNFVEELLEMKNKRRKK